MAGTFELAAERRRISDSLVTGIGALDSEADAGRLLQSFADLLVEATPHCHLTWFYIGDPDAPEIRPQYCAGPERRYGETLVVGRSRMYLRGPVRRTLQTGEPVVQRIPATLNAIQRLIPGVAEWHGRALEAGVRSVLAMSFPMPNGRDRGITVVYADHEAYFDEVGLDPFVTVSRFVQIGLDRIGLREAESRGRRDLDRLSREDALTGVFNRRGFESAVERVQSAEPGGWVLLQVDLDDFAALNASAGNELADQVLREAARRLKTFAGAAGFVARSGADDFLLAVRSQTGAVEDLAEACGEYLSRPPMMIGAHKLDVTAVVGATSTTDSEPLQLPERQRELSVAVAAARAEGPGAVCVYQRGLELARRPPQGVLATVRAGLEADEFHLWLQPQVKLGDGEREVYGAEGLVRWRRRGEMVSPGEFIDAVERSPLIRELGVHMLDQTLRCLDQWRGRHAPRLAVNIGVRHLLHPAFMDDVEQGLDRFPDVDPRSLTLEITERAALSDLERVCAVLERLRARGVRVALDDFGTGHAALTHLQVLPLDYLKLDRSFVTDLDVNRARFAIAHGLLTTARGLGLKVVAEGVERAGEAATLTELGCEIAQGFFYARPMPRTAFETWCVGERQSLS